jgi:hypothetical protein
MNSLVLTAAKQISSKVGNSAKGEMPAAPALAGKGSDC